MKKTLIVMLSEQQHEELRREAFKGRISMSEITRRALDSYLINKPAQESPFMPFLEMMQK